MKNNQNDIVSGDQSTNIQGRDHVTVNQFNGLTYQEVKEIAMNIFKSNFYELGEKASEIARERAEQITNDYLKKLEVDSPESINNVADPDVQYAIFTAQKGFARLGNREIADLLVDVLVNRTKINDDSLLKLVLNESLDAIQKLTMKQINALTLIFLMNSVRIQENIRVFIELLNKFADDLSLEPSFYQHMQYVGCVSISIGEKEFNNLFKMHYPIELEKKDITSVLLHIEPNIGKLQDYWKRSYAKNLSLTSVGIAIAHANLAAKTNITGELSIWIRE